MNHYRIRGISNDRFKSYVSNRNQYVSINGYESGLAAINCGLPQGSALGPLLFLLNINDLNQAIKFCKVHHFAYDINLLCLSNSIKKINKVLNTDLKHLVNWLNANKTRGVATGGPRGDHGAPTSLLNQTRSNSYSFKHKAYCFLWVFRNYTDQKFNDFYRVCYNFWTIYGGFSFFLTT